ncbi:hypothetical protein SLS53_009409 [Cytospora paraplurivora]|uniref:Tyrosine specific protein phosphatases domain-containing protein n=1 Tax=Cytospora paraplurivora TaxID=2898453 RepID=A0AAN9TVG3_9PEZI
MAWGSLPKYENGVPKGGIATEDVWTSLNIPIFLIAGGKDHITPANKIQALAELLSTGISKADNGPKGSQQPIVDVAAPVDTTVKALKPAESIEDISEEHFSQATKTASRDQNAETDPTTPHEQNVVNTPPQPSRPEKYIDSSRKWGGVIKDIVDISKDTPVYDPAGLERAGVRYHKFPTVSKIPPTDDEVDRFIKLVDRLREEQKSRVVEESWDVKAEHAIGVHCHYGFNRTGYFIVCYLVEKCGFGVQQAIDAFAEARPKGIRHSHFKDQLFVRYSELRAKAP